MKKVMGLITAICLFVVVLCGLSITAAAAGDSIATAEEIYLGETNYGEITNSHTKDVYKLKLSSSGCITIDITAYINQTFYYVYDENGKEIWNLTYQYWNENTGVYKNTFSIDLKKGTYYFVVAGYNCYGSYHFSTSFKSASESFTETQNSDNNSIRDADALGFGKKYKGQLAVNDDKDLYKITATSSGCVTIDVSAYINQTFYYLYDENGKEIWNLTYQYWNENTEVYKKTLTFHLTKGTYYFAICGYHKTGNYTLGTSFKSASETFTETQSDDNNSIQKADKITRGKTYKGQIAINDNKDLYKFTLSSADRVTLNIRAYIYRTEYYLYDQNGNEVWRETYQYWNSTSKVYTRKQELNLNSGTYYFAVCGYNNDGTGNYSFSLSCNHQWKTSSVSKATLSASGKANKTCSLCGSTTSITVRRPYSFRLSGTKYTYNGKVKTPSVTVKDTAGNVLKKNKDYTVTYASGRKNVGTYKVTVKMKGNYSGTKTLTFKINPISISKCSIKLSTTKYTYNGKTKTPSVVVKNANKTTLKKNTNYTVSYASGRKNVGTYKVTVKMKGNYSGSKTLTFKVLPSKASLTKLSFKGSTVKAHWKAKTSQCTGYQVQYSKSRSFSSYKNKTITNYKTSSAAMSGFNSKQTIYVRIRTYKTVRGTKYYSLWTTYKYVNGRVKTI